MSRLHSSLTSRMAHRHASRRVHAQRSRMINAHASSSAFSSSANPDEDWTKVQDLAERRRIQNRIAQRNYRKKLKRRLEDLERRAESLSLSPPQSHAEIQDRGRGADMYPNHLHHHTETPQQVSPIFSNPHHYSSPVEVNLVFSHPYQRDPSLTPPPSILENSSQSSPLQQNSNQRHQVHVHPQESYPIHDLNYSSYPLSEHSRIFSGSDQFGEYLLPVPMPLPSMLNLGQMVKQESDTIDPYNLDFSEFSGMGIPGPQSYCNSSSLALPHPPSYEEPIIYPGVDY